ncbi:internal scaffolding protein [Microviridae sp.]|nr:internal scaffolding protein [Microviridae sp.]
MWLYLLEVNMPKKVVPFRTAFEEHERHGFETEGESLTQQHFSEESEINNIIAYHDRTGIIKNVQQGVAQYGDYSEINEYRENLDMIRAADENFMRLPSDIRRKFNNNAGDFFEFATNPQNEQELVDMGLAKARPKEVGHNLANTATPSSESLNNEEDGVARTVTT